MRKHLLPLLRSPALSRWATFHSLMHVVHYLLFPLLLAWLVVHVVVTIVADVPAWLLVGGFLGTTPGPLAFLLIGQARTDRDGTVGRALAVVPLTLVGVGIAWRMTRAVVSGLVQTGGVFERTPKFRIEGRRRSWRDRAYDSPLNDTRPGVILCGWCTLEAGVAVLAGAPRMAPSLGFFALSFAVVVGFAARQR